MKFKNLQADYHGNIVFSGLTGQLEKQKLTMLLGQNGAGKSTLMQALCGLKEVQGKIISTEGTIYLPQKNQVFDYLKVKDLLKMALSKGKRGTDIALVDHYLDLGKLMEREILNLSDGQQQRVWLAYALIQNKDITMLDEPLTSLDLKFQQRLLKLLVKLKQEAHQTFLISIHDPLIARKFGDVIWLLDKHGLKAGAPTDLLTDNKINEFFELE